MGELVGEGWDEERFDRCQRFFPETGHNHDHGGVGQGLLHDGEVLVEVSEQRVESLCDVLRRGTLDDGLRSSCAEVVCN